MTVVEDADTCNTDVNNEKINTDSKCTTTAHQKVLLSTNKDYNQSAKNSLLDKRSQVITILAEKNFSTTNNNNNLLIENNSTMSSKQKKDAEDSRVISNFIPPDGGVRAWMILLGSFIINGVLFSIINSYSLMQVQLTEKLKQMNETSPEAKASLVGSLTIGTTFFLSPISGILTDKIGIQVTTFVGGLMAFGGMLLSSVYCSDVTILCLTYGVMYGTGASLAYTPSLVILGHYFKRRLGLANGIVTAGSSVFTTIMPYVMSTLLDQFGMVGALRSLAILTLVIMMCAFLFKPTMSDKDKANKLSSYKQAKNDTNLKKVDSNNGRAMINLTIWKKKRYVVWASAIPLALFGYFVPYVFIGSFVKQNFGEDYNRKIPVMCIGITSGIGRLVFGYIADIPGVNRILLQQISFISIGILTMVLPFTPPYYTALVIIALLFGLFDGCFISLLGPIAFDICGKAGATQAIGFLLGICSIPLTAGPPIGGLIIESTGSYTPTFILAGIPPIIGALVMFVIRYVKDDVPKNCTSEKLNNDGSINSDACVDESKELEILSGYKGTATLSA